ncbi:hypothetical protein ACF07F_16505 [Streptomyces sp. NPDC015237]|uniref:hypothetical protein n=1 Tax=Streptomyces sp. NPDC015237 TaxID=3364949 RepID=UPI003701028E
MNTRTTAAALAAGALLALTACTSSSDDKPKAETKPPAYTVVDREEAGHTRQITIEVDSTKELRAVFDDATKDLSENAGYTVLINCSTGGTKSMDNRLANGTYAIGNFGSAATGLDDGEKQFEPVTGRTCPAKG